MLISVIVSQVTARAQFFPQEGAQLHYRLIGFKAPDRRDISVCKIEIATGYHTKVDSFEHTKRENYTGATSRIIGEVASFNQAYTWRVVYNDTNGNVTKSDLFHFKTLPLPGRDTGKIRLRVTKNLLPNSETYIFSDRSRTLCNLAGEPVWFLPDIEGVVQPRSEIRDLKVSQAGSITFMTANRGYEINYNGELLWQTPRNNKFTNDTIEMTHHEFTRLANGHYMTLGSEVVYWEWRHATPSHSFLFMVTPQALRQNPLHTGYVKMLFGTVLEYDQKGKVVWHWKSSDHYRAMANNYVSPVSAAFDIHENGFTFDERNKVIYLSFKNINRVFKVKYPEGTLVSELGGVKNNEDTTKLTDLFCDQHSCKISKTGDLFVFNNNSCNRGHLPRVMLMRQPRNEKEELRTVWDYTYEQVTGHASTQWTNGGNIVELPDTSIFVSLCAPYGNLFIVNREKQVLWDAVIEKWDNPTRKWASCWQYRASVISSRKELERMVWGKSKITLK